MTEVKSISCFLTTKEPINCPFTNRGEPRLELGGWWVAGTHVGWVFTQHSAKVISHHWRVIEARGEREYYKDIPSLETGRPSVAQW